MTSLVIIKESGGTQVIPGLVLCHYCKKMFLTKCTFYFILVEMKEHHLRFLHLWNIAKNKNNFHFSDIKQIIFMLISSHLDCCFL